jgi:hypothetical protein
MSARRQHPASLRGGNFKPLKLKPGSGAPVVFRYATPVPEKRCPLLHDHFETAARPLRTVLHAIAPTWVTARSHFSNRLLRACFFCDLSHNRYGRIGWADPRDRPSGLAAHASTGTGQRCRPAWSAGRQPVWGAASAGLGSCLSRPAAAGRARLRSPVWPAQRRPAPDPGSPHRGSP